MIEDIGPPLFDDAREPSGIRLYSFDDDEFILFGELDLEHTIRCFTVGDVDANGKPEIVTQETSNDGEVLHQISIYDVSSTGEITHQFSKNRVLPFSLFPTRLREMRIFTDNASNTYVSAYKRRDRLLRVYNKNGIEDIKEIEADVKLRAEAFRQRHPFDGSSYAVLANHREPRLVLYSREELDEHFSRYDRP